MGKIDTEAKAYLSNAERFSDIFNFWIFDGQNIIKPDELQEMDTTSIAIPFSEKSRKHVQKYRDMLKLYAAKHDGEAMYLILGLEAEAKYTMLCPSAPCCTMQCSTHSRCKTLPINAASAGHRRPDTNTYPDLAKMIDCCQS